MRLKDIAKIITPTFAKSDRTSNLKEIIVSAGLKEDNLCIVESIDDDNIYDTKVMIDDIIIKRVSPQYVNLINREIKNSYYGTNLIVIRVYHNKYHPKYITHLISKNLPKLESLSNSGTRFYSLNRKTLESVEIPNISFEKQIIIGNLWESLNKQSQLIKRILEKNKTLKKIFEESV